MSLILPASFIPMQLVAHASPTLTPNEMALFNILQSCLATVLLCTWVTVHPNVPFNSTPDIWNLGILRQYRTRRGLLVLTFAAPEIVLVIAYNEWVKACQHTTELSSLSFHHQIYNLYTKTF